MASSLDHIRASRYRRLALAEKDKAKAALLSQLAHEAELGILFTADRGLRPSPTTRLMQSCGLSKSGMCREIGFPL